MSYWLLPDYVVDILPSQAQPIEFYRRFVLDTFDGYGYDLVMPSMLERAKVFLDGPRDGLHHKTFQFPDQVDGQMLALRSDLTPQIIRLDEHTATTEGARRWCYCSSALQTLPDRPEAKREMLQTGIELFGVPDIQAEHEVLSILTQVLSQLSLPDLYIEIGHTQLALELLTAHSVHPELIEIALKTLGSQDWSALDRLLEQPNLLDTQKKLIEQLFHASGHHCEDIIAQMQEWVSNEHTSPYRILQDLIFIHKYCQPCGVQVGLSLSQKHSHSYHQGITFRVYSSAFSIPIAQGGRYPHKARGKTHSVYSGVGFSFDLSSLGRHYRSSQPSNSRVVVAPYYPDAFLDSERNYKISQLRQEGKRVLSAFSPQESSALLKAHAPCAALVFQEGAWCVISPHELPLTE